MSWSLEGSGLKPETITNLDTAIQEAKQKNILMFASASDQGEADRNKDIYPASCDSVITIGSCTSDGGDPSTGVRLDQVAYLIPGEEIRVTDDQDLISGSSVSAALASGLAALVLHCIDIYLPPYLETPETQRQKSDDYRRVRRAFKLMAQSGKYLNAPLFFKPGFGKMGWEDTGAGSIHKMTGKEEFQNSIKRLLEYVLTSFFPRSQICKRNERCELYWLT